MKAILFSFVLIGVPRAFSVPKTDCLNGNFSACRELFNNFGSQSDHKGAVELFEKACSAQTLRVSCEIISSAPADTMKKMLEIARKPGSGMFVNTGSKLDKIYLISELK